MSYPSNRVKYVSYPQAKLRMYWSIPTAIFFSVLLSFASLTLRWFTPLRGLYVILGIAEGLLVGLLEANIVTGALMKKSEAVAWQMVPIYLLSGLPLLLVIFLYGTSEFLPFGAYLVLPYVPAYYASSGWRYSKFEKERKVRILMFIYGLWFWLEDVDVSHRFTQFVGAVASKDSQGILNQVGYFKDITATIRQTAKIKPSTKNVLSEILETLRKYRRRSTAIGWIFISSMLILIIYFFELVITNTFGLVTVVNGEIVSGRDISLILGTVPTILVFAFPLIVKLHLNRNYKKRMSALLASLSPDAVSDLKNLSPPVGTPSSSG